MLYYMRGFLILVLLLTLLLYLIPGEEMKRYIRFFTEIMLMLGILSPVLSVLFDKDKFLELIAYETFAENFSELERGAERIAFTQNEYYMEKYEEAVAEDVRQIVQPIAEIYGCQVREAEAELTETYQLARVTIFMEHPPGDNGMTEEIKKKISEYYHMDVEAISVQYAGFG